MSQQGDAAISAALRTGDPAALQAQARAWSGLAAELRGHEAEIRSRLARSRAGGDWSGPAADAFHSSTGGLTGGLDALSDRCEDVARALEQHAHQQQRISDVLVEIAIQVAALIAYIAAAAFFPPLVATAEAYIATLVAQSNRMLALLGEVLATLTRWLASARTAIKQLAQRSWRGEAFSFGYGRALVEGTRDFAIDLAATSTASGITGKGTDPGHLFTNAAISLGVGGAFGGISGSGVSKKIGPSGEVARTPDGRPEFATFAGQIDEGVRSLRWTSPGGREAAPPEAAPRARREQELRELDSARSGARELGVRGHPRERRRLTDEAGIAQARASRAQDELTAARSALRDAESGEARARSAWRAARGRVNDAEQRLWRAESLLAVYQHSPQRGWLDDAEAAARRARSEHDGSRREATALRDQHDRAVRELDAARDSANAAGREADQADGVVAELRRMLAASDELRSAATRFNAGAPFGARLRELWRHNGWRASFGAVKPWPVILFHESARDVAKGATGAAAQSAAGIANGSRAPGSTERDVLFGALAGGVRGVAVGTAGNRALPDGGVEEILLRTGLKSTETFTRDQLNAMR
ncbi:WXG100 family type VII secretion target [Saccharopolyspora sp. MS10]|uniref:WXG100 family type VII secretion target n=1 Tax=Saccharopolyspora sp. MS10 TaxID=3385973 RepID=UPI0039A1CE38